MNIFVSLYYHHGMVLTNIEDNGTQSTQTEHTVGFGVGLSYRGLCLGQLFIDFLCMQTIYYNICGCIMRQKNSLHNTFYLIGDEPVIMSKNIY